MLFVYYGTDTLGIRAAAYEAAETAGGDLHVIDGDRFEVGMLRDVASSVSLFGAEAVYLLDTPSSLGAFQEELVSLLPTLAESAQHFIVIEGKLLAADKKRYQKYASEMNEQVGEGAARFNTFLFADALARKDRKTLWLLYQEARRADIAPEEIVGVLWWQLKALRLAAMTNSASEAGMKDYPYRKAKGALRNFTKEELEQFSTDLITIQHESRRGTHDFDLALEHWLLALTQPID